MNKKFTASEVRSAIGALEARDMEYEAGMLRAFADLLEEREKGVPVGCLTVQRFRGSGAMVNHDFDYYGSLPDGSYSLYTQSQSAPSDTERLADAVFPSHRASVPYENHPGKRIVGFVIDESHPWWGKCGLTEPLSALEAALTAQENPNG